VATPRGHPCAGPVEPRTAAWGSRSRGSPAPPRRQSSSRGRRWRVGTGATPTALGGACRGRGKGTAPQRG